MALPKLNTITYNLNLPSTGDTVKFRPFLVKEQKALMIAQESEDDKQIQNAFAQIINDCTFGELDAYNLPMFDIEYVFLQLRGKSVGEKVQLNVLCPDDEKTRVDVEINLKDVDIQMVEDHTNIIQLTDNVSVIMKYPTLSDMEGFAGAGDSSQVSSVFSMMKRCIHEVRDGETVYNKVDITEKELDDFIESMSTENFENFSAFFETMPKLQHMVIVKNPKTKKKNEILIEGLQSFFG